MAGERLSTLAKVQVAAFLKYGEWAWRLRGEWGLIASYRRCPTVKGDLELLDYAKTDAYRLALGKYNAEENLRLLRGAGERLQFRYAAPFPLIREACQAYLHDTDPSAGIREISIQLETSSDRDTLAVDVCADIYRTLFPCPYCSGPYMTEVFHHVGENARELRFELHFDAWDYRIHTDGRIERALYSYAHCQAKACLSRVHISADPPKCRRPEAPAIRQSLAIPSFFEYGADVLAHLSRDDIDKLQLISLRWSRTLKRMRATLPIRPLCVEMRVEHCPLSVEISVYNPLVYKDGSGTDRRLMKFPHQSPDIDSAVVAGHLRNSYILCLVAGHAYREAREEHECCGARWMCEMMAGLDNCQIGELHLDLSDTLPDVDGFVNVVAHRRPKKLDFLIWTEQQHDRLFAAHRFWTAAALGTTELVSLHVQPEWTSAVVPAWKNYWLSSPLRRMRIYYSTIPGTAAVGFRYAIDDIIEEFLAISDRGNPPKPSALYFSVACRVPLIREERVCTRPSVHAPPADRLFTGVGLCDEYVFHNACVQKELTVYVWESEHHSSALCRIE